MVRILTFCQVFFRGSRVSLSATVPGASSTQAVSSQLHQNCWGGENFPLALLVLLADLKIKLTQNRLTGGKKIQFCTCRGLIAIGPKK